VQRLEHYFLTYKQIPGKETNVSIEKLYGRADAYRVIEAAMDDYQASFVNQQEETGPA
jgi:inorganic pyrophosphatase